jgi:tetratricopeptide (TPR) repeat protein
MTSVLKNSAARTNSCSLVMTLIADWAKVKSKPFPYLQVGEHLAQCPTCLSWATAIAYEPTEHYVRALRSRLSWVISILGQSVLRAWSSNQDLTFDIVCAQDPETVRDRISRRLSQCESFNSELKEQVSQIREVMPDLTSGALPGGLEPYPLARYFLETALTMAPQSEQRLKLLDQLGIAEFTAGVGEQRAGRKEQADRHFEQAKEYYREVMAVDVRGGTDATDLKVGEKVDQVSARLSLAQVEYVQGGLSQPSLQTTIELCLDAKRLVTEQGLVEEEFTRILSNLLICYLRLFLDHSKTGAYDQAQQLAKEVCARPTVARVFLKRWVVDGEDPELTQLLASPQVKDLSDYLKLEAQRVPHVRAVPVRQSR